MIRQGILALLLASACSQQSASNPEEPASVAGCVGVGYSLTATASACLYQDATRSNYPWERECWAHRLVRLGRRRSTRRMRHCLLVGNTQRVRVRPADDSRPGIVRVWRMGQYFTSAMGGLNRHFVL